MKLSALISSYRLAAHDQEQPYFVSDEAVVEFLNEAVKEAAIRSRLLHESADDDVCKIEVSAGRSIYPLHKALYEISYSALRLQSTGEVLPIKLISTQWLDRNIRDWRYAVGKPQFAVQNDTHIRLVPEPVEDGVLILEGYRMPLVSLDLADPDSEPEISEAMHLPLVQWVLFRAFSIPDSEFFDPSRAARAEAEFTQFFGLRPDADMRRATRHDTPQVNEPYWI